MGLHPRVHVSAQVGEKVRSDEEPDSSRREGRYRTPLPSFCPRGGRKLRPALPYVSSALGGRPRPPGSSASPACRLGSTRPRSDRTLGLAASPRSPRSGRVSTSVWHLALRGCSTTMVTRTGATSRSVPVRGTPRGSPPRTTWLGARARIRAWWRWLRRYRDTAAIGGRILGAAIINPLEVARSRFGNVFAESAGLN